MSTASNLITDPVVSVTKNLEASIAGLPWCWEKSLSFIWSQSNIRCNDTADSEHFYNVGSDSSDTARTQGLRAHSAEF